MYEVYLRYTLSKLPLKHYSLIKYSLIVLNFYKGLFSLKDQIFEVYK